jgi:hypothetical protein
MESMGSIDIISLIVMIVGGLVFFVGWIWLIILGFKQSIWWGILMILFNWFAAIVFCIVKKTGWLGLAIMTIGGIAAGVGAAPLISRLIRAITRL